MTLLSFTEIKTESVTALPPAVSPPIINKLLFGAMILRRPDLAIIRPIYPISRYAKDEYQRYMIFQAFMRIVLTVLVIFS